MRKESDMTRKRMVTHQVPEEIYDTVVKITQGSQALMESIIADALKAYVEENKPKTLTVNALFISLEKMKSTALVYFKDSQGLNHHIGDVTYNKGTNEIILSENPNVNIDWTYSHLGGTHP